MDSVKKLVVIIVILILSALTGFILLNHESGVPKENIKLTEKNNDREDVKTDDKQQTDKAEKKDIKNSTEKKVIEPKSENNITTEKNSTESENNQIDSGVTEITESNEKQEKEPKENEKGLKENEKRPEENEKKPEENEKRPEENEKRSEENEKRPEENEKKPEENEKKPEENEKRPEENEKRPEENEKRPEENEKKPEENEKRPEENEKRPEENENSDDKKQLLEKAKQEFLETHKEILSLTVDTIGIEYEQALNKALEAYGKLGKSVQEELRTEKQLLDSLKQSLTEKQLKEKAKREFLETHKEILSLTVDTIGTEHEQALNKALEAYGKLDKSVQEELRTEKQLLDSLREKLNQISDIDDEGILNREIYRRFKSSAPNSEVTQYIYNNEVRTILWVRGVKALNMQQDGSGDFKKFETPGQYIDYHAPFKNGQGWYDVNKSRTDDDDVSLCFAATASNSLHWWLKENDSYVQRYIQKQIENGYYDNISDENISPTRDLRKLVDSYKSQQDSMIFNKFKIDFGNKIRGFFADIVEDYFINGHTPKDGGGTNVPGRDFEKNPKAGFFNDVFGSNILTERMYSGRYDTFGKDVKNKISQGKILAVQHSAFNGFVDHVITIWAAEFNTKGEITAIYVTDSDDQYQESQLGMKRYIVKNVNGYARTTSSINPATRGAEINFLYTLDLGTQYWEKYFAE